MATNGGGAGGSRGGNVRIRYKECMRNHALQPGRYVYDGCAEFIKSGDDGTPQALLCAACGCHRIFHRKEEIPIRCFRVVRLRLYNHPSVAAAATAPPPLLPPHLLAFNNVGPSRGRSDALGDVETPEEN